MLMITILSKKMDTDQIILMAKEKKSINFRIAKKKEKHYSLNYPSLRVSMLLNSLSNNSELRTRILNY